MLVNVLVKFFQSYEQRRSSKGEVQPKGQFCHHSLIQVWNNSRMSFFSPIEHKIYFEEY